MHAVVIIAVHATEMMSVHAGVSFVTLSVNSLRSQLCTKSPGSSTNGASNGSTSSTTGPGTRTHGVNLTWLPLVLVIASILATGYVWAQFSTNLRRSKVTRRAKSFVCVGKSCEIRALKITSTMKRTLVFHLHLMCV